MSWPGLKSREWVSQQGTGDWDEVIFGDAIFQVAEEVAQAVEGEWQKIAKVWYTLINKSVKQGLFGFGRPIVDSKWLLYMIFARKNLWPPGLSAEDKDMLTLATKVAQYYPLYAQGVRVDRTKGITLDPEEMETTEDTAKAMRRYATMFRKMVYDKMESSFESAVRARVNDVSKACKVVYGTECSKDEASRMIVKDIMRGWRNKTLAVDPDTSGVIPAFIDIYMKS